MLKLAIAGRDDYSESMQVIGRKKVYEIIEALDEKDQPKSHERQAAKIIAEYYQSDIRFIRRNIGSTPDIYVLKTKMTWEIKSPMGGSKRTIDNNLRKASDQSKNIFLDLSRTTMNQNEAIARARNFVNGKYAKHCHLKKLKIITKNKRIIDIL